jgi:single-stranded-DNA-specific exonuclease
VPGVDLGRAVIAAVEAGLIARGGGHAMAAGVTLRMGELGGFRAHLLERLSEAVTVARAATALDIDAALTARGATTDLVHDIDRAGPFGAGNPQPVFAFPAHRARFPDIVGAAGHVRFTLASEDGARLKAIAFRAGQSPIGEAIMAAGGEAPLHIAGTLGVDHWQGREEVQLRVTDVARPAAF